MHNQTKKLIANTLSEMIKDHPFDSITITELVERCNISRQTFYYHFADLLDVLEMIFENKIESVIFECNETMDLLSSIKIMLKAGQENQRILHVFLDSRLRGRIEHRLLYAIKNGLTMGFEKFPSSRPLNNEQITLMLEFISYGILGALLYRDLNELDDLDRIAKGIYALIINTIAPNS